MNWKDFVGTLPDAKVIRLRGMSLENFDKGEKERYQAGKIPLKKDWTSDEKENEQLINVWANERNNGWLGLVIPAGVIVLDVDNKHNPYAPDLMAGIIRGESLKCHSIVTPNGRQFVFRVPAAEIKQGAGLYTPLGIVIDTRTAGDGQIVLPTENTEGRYFESICEGELDTYPEWLHTTWNANGQTLPSYPISEGGRNDFMFRWACKIASQGQTRVQVDEVMRLVNTYLIKPPLPINEVTAVIDQAFQGKYVQERQAKQLEYEASERRAQWWKMNAKGTEKFLHHIMAQYIATSFQIVRYGDENGVLYYFDADEGYYKADTNSRLINATIRQLDNTLTIQQVREVATFVYESSQVIKEWDRTHIPMKNGLWNIFEKKLDPFSPSIHLDYKIDVNYNDNAYSEFIDQTLNKISNSFAPTRLNLEEILGSVVSPDLEARFAWFLFGRTAHNGKSFFLYLISQLIDQKFIGTLSPHDVAKSQFKIAELYGKKVNLIDEVGTGMLPDFDKIKSLITGGFQAVEFKGKSAFTAKIEVTQVWASNFFPNIREEGNQVNRRLEIIPFDYNFSKDPDKLPDTVAENLAKSVDSKEYLLKLAIDGMYRLKANNGDPSPNEKRNQQKEEFASNNDKLAEWLDTMHLIADEGCYNQIDTISGREIFNLYLQWCHENNEKNHYHIARFKNEIMKRFNLKWEKKRLIDLKSGREDGNPVWRFVQA